MNTQTSYSEKDIVKKYSHLTSLFKGEIAILKDIEGILANSNVLDVGVGAGRTTMHLAKLSKKYTGIDYSQEMVNYCKKTYPRYEFHTMDARNLSYFNKLEFDIVLFSFNGIDCVDKEGRNRIIKEVNRVLKEKGYFIFSFHNTRNIKKLYSFQVPKNPFKWVRELKRVIKVKKINGDIKLFDGLDYFSIFDGGDNFRTKIFYSKPEVQIEQLGTIFSSIKAFDAASGEVLNKKDLLTSDTPWIYLICQK